MVHVPALQRRGGGLGPPREAPATPSRHVNNGRTVEGGYHSGFSSTCVSDIGGHVGRGVLAVTGPRKRLPVSIAVCPGHRPPFLRRRSTVSAEGPPSGAPPSSRPPPGRSNVEMVQDTDLADLLRWLPSNSPALETGGPFTAGPDGGWSRPDVADALTDLATLRVDDPDDIARTMTDNVSRIDSVNSQSAPRSPAGPTQPQGAASRRRRP